MGNRYIGHFGNRTGLDTGDTPWGPELPGGGGFWMIINDKIAFVCRLTSPSEGLDGTETEKCLADVANQVMRLTGALFQNGGT